MKRAKKTTYLKVGIIGAGNMGEALVKGLAQKKDVVVSVFEKDRARQNIMVKKYGVKKKSIEELTKTADAVIICVKPQNVSEVFCELKNGLKENHLLISIAAGLSTAHIEQAVGRKLPVIRVMPNMPGLIGQGVSACCLGRYAKPKHGRIAEEIFSAIGRVLMVKESKMDAVTALSGSGPGFLAYMIEGLKQGGIEAGLSLKEAEFFAVNMAAGTGNVLAERIKDPGKLARMVASKGGTTEAGLNVLEKNKITGIMKRTIKAAAARSKELSK